MRKAAHFAIVLALAVGTPRVYAGVILEDGFESYALGPLGTQGPWQDVVGFGVGNFIVSSPTKTGARALEISMDLDGASHPEGPPRAVFQFPCRLASGSVEVDVRRETSSSHYVAVYLSEGGTTDMFEVDLGLSGRITYFGGGTGDLRGYVADQWYHVRIDWFANSTANVTIDDVLVGAGLPMFAPMTQGISSLTLGVFPSAPGQEHGWFDNVRVTSSFQDGFEGYSLGTLDSQGPWVDAPGFGIGNFIVDSPVKTGSRALEISMNLQTAGTGVPPLSLLPFPSHATSGTIEVDVMKETNQDDYVDVALCEGPSAGSVTEMFAVVWSYQGTIRYYGPGSLYLQLPGNPAYNGGQWYHLRLDWFANSTASISIDGALIASNLPFHSTMSDGIGWLKLMVLPSDAPHTEKGWFDNVRATLPGTFCSYSIIAGAGANGSISPAGNVLVTEGGSQSFDITPAPGYAIDEVLVDAASQGAPPSYTFTNVSANHTILASFRQVADVGATRLPAGIALSAWPNPSAGSLRAELTLPRRASVALRVLDLQGREMAVIARGTFEAGRHEVHWNGATSRGPVPAGLYLLRLDVAGESLVRRVTIIR